MCDCKPVSVEYTINGKRKHHVYCNCLGCWADTYEQAMNDYKVARAANETNPR